MTRSDIARVVADKMLRRYCTCGANVSASSDPPSAAEFVVEMFSARHSGEGHAPTDAATARKARARKEATR